MKGKSRKQDTRNLQRRGGVWWIRIRLDGVEIRQSLQTSDLEEARRRRDDLQSRLTGKRTAAELLQAVKNHLDAVAMETEAERSAPAQGIRLDEAFKMFERDPSRRECKPDQLANHQSKWRRFLQWMKENHPDIEFCRQVTKAIGREWAAWMNEKAKSINTYNHHLSTVHHVFNSLCGYDDYLHNPFENIHIKPDRDSQSKQPFSEDELRRIFAYPDEEFCRLCAIGLYTALRLDSARHLQWSKYDGTILEATHDKTGADATLIVPDTLKHWLDKVPLEERDGYICPSFAKLTRQQATKRIQANFQRLGIQTQIITTGHNGKTRTACIKGFHSFRHTAITLAQQNGATISQVKRWAGHSSERMQERYTHLGAADAGKAASTIGKYWD